jgi:hypothetical protein
MGIRSFLAEMDRWNQSAGERLHPFRMKPRQVSSNSPAGRHDRLRQ